MSNDDREEFTLYLASCSDAQVRGVYEKERDARRTDYAKLAREEAIRRRITL